MIPKTCPEFFTWKVKENHESFLLNYRKHNTERAEREIKKNNENNCSNLFTTIEGLLGKCDLLFEDDNDIREKAEEFIPSTG